MQFPQIFPRFYVDVEENSTHSTDCTGLHADAESIPPSTIILSQPPVGDYAAIDGRAKNMHR